MKTILLLAIAAILMGVVFTLKCYNNFAHYDQTTGTHYIKNKIEERKRSPGYNLCVKGRCDNDEYFACSNEDDICIFLGSRCRFCTRIACNFNFCNAPNGALPICPLLLNIGTKLVGLIAIGFLAIGTLMIAEGRLI